MQLIAFLLYRNMEFIIIIIENMETNLFPQNGSSTIKHPPIQRSGLLNVFQKAKRHQSYMRGRRNILNSNSRPKVQSIAKSLRNSLTPFKNTFPIQPLPCQPILSSAIRKSSTHEQKLCESMSTNDCQSRLQHTQFIKKADESTPLVFLRGIPHININVKQQIVEIMIGKLVNYSDEQFDNLCCYLLGTQSAAMCNSLKLSDGNYQLMGRCGIQIKIGYRKCYKNIRLESRLQSVKKEYINLVLVLKDEKTKRILYWINYVDWRKLMNGSQKINIFDQYI